jgi:hypothetical protein
VKKRTDALKQVASLAFAVSFVVLICGDCSAASAQRRLEVGTLSCRLGPSVGLILGSRQRMRCRFVSFLDRSVEHYQGTVTKFGLDLGMTVGGVMQWRVIARSRRVGRGALAGHFVGASASVAAGVGVGAKVLVGGSRRTTVLQPLSVSGRVGINLAAGVAGLTLRFNG